MLCHVLTSSCKCLCAVQRGAKKHAVELKRLAEEDDQDS